MTSEFAKGVQYKISEVVFIATQVHDKSVVMRILDDQNNLRSYFLPEKHAEKFRQHFEDPTEINCYELYLKFNGFKDEVKKMQPLIEIIYLGEAQHS